jgi:hypothetical protein
MRSPDPNSVYGPFAYGLSAHSDVLQNFDGGDAEVGVHGNNDASVLGKSVTHGCVRIDNDEITQLSKILPLGTPVDIVPRRLAAHNPAPRHARHAYIAGDRSRDARCPDRARSAALTW